MYKFFNGNLSGQYFKPSLTVRLLKLREASPCNFNFWEKNC